MSSLDAKKSYKNMLSKGFVEVTYKSTDHKRIEFWHEGKLTRARTMFSHNNQDLNDYLIGQMSKQVCLTRNQFIEFANCTLSLENYVDILRSAKIIS
jgi:hypothetical protein